VALVLAGAIPVLLLVVLLRSWSTDEGDRARATVERFGTAVVTRDYPLICRDLLASRLRETLQQAGVPCEQALRTGLGEVRSPTLRVVGATVEGDDARVDVRTGAAGQPSSEDALRLVREDGQWRITALTTAGEEPTPTSAGRGATTAPTPPTGDDPTHTVTDTTPIVPGSVPVDGGPTVAPDVDPVTPGATTTATTPRRTATLPEGWPRPPQAIVEELRGFATAAEAERERRREERRERRRALDAQGDRGD